MTVAIQAGEAQLPARTASVALSLGALGIVYGDIGTSPLYALKETVKVAAAGGTLQHDAVLGSVSLILWSLFLIAALKYAVLILRADNHGGVSQTQTAVRSRIVSHSRPACRSVLGTGP